MATLIQSQKSDGTIIGRCDAKCHDAKGPKCTCICGGMNHGVGINKVIDNTHEHSHLLMDAQEAGEFIIKEGQYQLFNVAKP